MIDRTEKILKTFGNVTQKFVYKKEALEVAKALGVSKNNVVPIELMGWKMWALTNDEGHYLTRHGFEMLLEEKGLEWS